MKKLFALSLALLMLFSLAACSSDADEDERDKSSSVMPDGTLPAELFGDMTTTTSDSTTQNGTATATATETADVDEDEDENESQQKTTTGTHGEAYVTENNDHRTDNRTNAATTTTRKPTTTTGRLTTSTTNIVATTSTTTPATASPATKPSATPNVYLRNDNNYITAGEVSINPRYVYWRNGNLVAECYVINGTSKTISRLKVDELTFMDSSRRVIAAADFGEVSINAIGRNQHQIVTFTFGTEDVRMSNARLSPLNWHFALQYI